MARQTILRPVAKTGRKSRRPNHTFNIRHRPWQLTPFMIAPVLPGETLKNLMWQSRAVSKPVKAALTGWWLEYYFFYVKHRDLDNREEFETLMLDIGTTTAALNSAAKVETYHRGTSIDWLQLCLNRIRDTYFRDEDEIGTAYDIGNLPAVHIGQQSWTDSLLTQGAYDTDMPELVVGVDDKITGGEVSQLLEQYEFLRANNLTDASYEDYLASFGVGTARVELHRPELIRYQREWSYPSNTVDPATGAPSSALSWSIASRADKDRFFTEPGFIVGLTVARPKVYTDNQQSTVSNELDRAIRWLPAILNNDPYNSLAVFASGSAGPIAGAATGYVFDLKDYFLYGEQFINYALADVENKVDLPDTAIINKRYADATDADNLFVGTTAATRLISQDGVVMLDILSHLTDTTPQGIQS